MALVPMTALVPADESGLWRFGDKDSLMSLLSIDFMCFGRNISRSRRCGNDLSPAKIQQTREILSRIAGQNLHSDTAATDLDNLLHACLCHVHVKAELMIGYGKDLNKVPYTEYIRQIWHGRLWAVYLKGQGVPGDLLTQDSPPSISEAEQWKARASRLRALPVPPLLRRISFFEKSSTPSADDTTSIRNSTSSSRITDIPKPGLRRAFTFGHLDKLTEMGIRLRRKKLTALPPPPPAKPALERKDETRHVPTLRTVAPSQDPVTPVKKGRYLDRAAKMPVRSASPEPSSPRRAPPASYDSSSDGEGPSLDGASPSPPPSTASSVFSRRSDDDFTPPTAPKVFMSASNGALDYGNPVEDSPLQKKSAARQCNTGPVKRDLFGNSTRTETRRESPSRTASTDFFSSKSQCDSDEAPETSDDDDTESHHRLDARATAHPDVQTQVGVGALESDVGTTQVDSAHHHFEPRKDLDQYTSLDNILKRLEGPASTRNREQGYIYLYTRKGAKGYIKIGCSIHPDQRVKEWASKCHYDVNTLESELMESVAIVMEKCIQDHLYQYRQDDLWCANGRVKDPSSGSGGTACRTRAAKGCTKRHIEWFKVSQGEAKRVVTLWSRFNKTTPFVRGRINSFWRDYIINLDGAVKKWREAGEPALKLWESIMNEGIERWETKGFNDPLAEIKLVIRARSEGCDHVIEILDPRKDGQPPMVITPLQLRMAAVKG